MFGLLGSGEHRWAPDPNHLSGGDHWSDLQTLHMSIILLQQPWLEEFKAVRLDQRNPPSLPKNCVGLRCADH